MTARITRITREQFRIDKELVLQLARQPGGVEVAEGDRVVCVVSIPSEPLSCDCDEVRRMSPVYEAACEWADIEQAIGARPTHVGWSALRAAVDAARKEET